jgi:hypothetical protein
MCIAKKQPSPVVLLPAFTFWLAKTPVKQHTYHTTNTMARENIQAYHQ